MSTTSVVAGHATRSLSCLLVEDDQGFAELLRAAIKDEGFEVKHCGSLAQARTALAGRPFDLAVLDNHLPDGKGFDFYFELTRREPSQTVILLTGLPELSHAVELTRNGLFDYLAKPVEADAFSTCLQRARTRIEHLKVNLKSDQMVAESPAMREVALQLQQAARHTTATVLLTGETGSGKDVAARTLHEWTHGAKASQVPFIAVNCASIPAEMFEAELFGAEKGAYTGADKIREGLAGATKEGTLFLDEIGEVPLPLQAKLLRFLEAREYRPLGSSNTRLFAGRVIAATNRLLRKEVAAGTFREDLMYRLDSFMVRMPPLRERRDEIPALAIRLLAQLAAKYHRKAPKLRDEDLNTLASYEFPGNVRELRNLMERSLLRSPLDSVTLALDHAWLNRPESSGVPPAPVMKQAVSTPSASTVSTRDLPPIESQEYEMIRQALAESNGGIRRAAARLGISHQALLRRLQKWPELRPANPE